MKRIISVLTMLVLTCTTCISVMAVPSPRRGAVPVRGTITLSDGSVIAVDDEETMQKYVVLHETDVQPEQISGYSVITTLEVEFKDGVQSAIVVLHIPGIKKGDRLIVRMLINGEWIDLEAEAVDDDMVQVKLTQAGVIEILRADSSQNNNGGNDNGNGQNNGSGDTKNNGSGGTNSSNGTQGSNSGVNKNTSTTSPKTGESNAFPMACAVFFGCVLAAAVSASRIRKK